MLEDVTQWFEACLNISLSLLLVNQHLTRADFVEFSTPQREQLKFKLSTFTDSLNFSL